MAIVREGNKAVLLVVDVQVGVMREAWDAPRVIKNVARAVERARAKGVPVIWVQHSDKDLVHGSPQWQWVPELVPAAGERRIDKRFESSFEQTALEQELAALGASHIALAGASTNWCIRATAYGALDRGYDLTLINDAHTTTSIELDNDTRIEAASMIQDLNIAMKWLSYPGRTSSTVTAAEVEFSDPGGARERASDEQQIRQLVSTWHDASRVGDTDTVLGLLTDDVVFLVAGRPPMRKEEFATLSRPAAGTSPPKIDGATEIQEIQVSGDWAFMWTKLSVRATPLDGAQPSERAGHTLTVLKRVNGTWLLARDANLLVPVQRSST